MKSIYESYKGLPCVSREIDPKTWTWTYLYENKLAKKNKAKYESLSKIVDTLNDKKNKCENDIKDVYKKFLTIVNNNDISIDNVNDVDYDNIKGITTIRNKITKNQNILNEVNNKLNDIEQEIKVLKEIGFDSIVKRKTDEMVYAYDMQNYVKLHPEQFVKK